MTATLLVNLYHAILADPSGLPIEALARATWMSNTGSTPATTCGIADIPSAYFLHASEIRRVAARKKRTYTFANTHSWLEVGLQLLKKACWWPECSQPQPPRIERTVPPDEFEARFFLDRTHTATERMVEFRGKRVPTSLMEVFGEVVRIDNVITTLVVLMANWRVLRSNDFVH